MTHNDDSQTARQAHADQQAASQRDHLGAPADRSAFTGRGWVNVPVAVADGMTSVRVYDGSHAVRWSGVCLHCGCADRLTMQGRHTDGCAGPTCTRPASLFVCATGGWGLPVCDEHAADQISLAAADPQHITPGVCVNC